MLGPVSTADTLENGDEPRPWLRRAGYALSLVVVAALVEATVNVLPWLPRLIFSVPMPE